MSESKSDDEKTGEELRKESLEKGFILDDTQANEQIYPEEEKKSEADDRDGNGDR